MQHKFLFLNKDSFEGMLLQNDIFYEKTSTQFIFKHNWSIEFKYERITFLAFNVGSITTVSPVVFAVTKNSTGVKTINFKIRYGQTFDSIELRFVV